MGDSAIKTINDVERIDILSTDEEKIKSLGELLSSEAGRKILNLIFIQEMSASEISNKTEMSLERVRYHLQKMLNIGIVEISRMIKNSRSQEMKYYRSKRFVVMVLPFSVSDKAKRSKSLFNALNKLFKGATISAAAIASWFITRSLASNGSIGHPLLTPLQPDIVSIDVYSITVIVLITIIASFVVNKFWKK